MPIATGLQILHYVQNDIFLNSEGLMPTIFLKYLLKNEGLGKFK